MGTGIPTIAPHTGLLTEKKGVNQEEPRYGRERHSHDSTSRGTGEARDVWRK